MTVGLRVTDDSGETAATSRVRQASSGSYYGAVSCDPRPARLLAPGREIGHDLRRQRRRQHRDLPKAESAWASRERLPATPTPRSASTAATTPRAQHSTSRAAPADARVLAQLGGLRQRRPPRLRVHAELQRQPRRLPGRPQRRRARRQVRRRDRPRRLAQQRLLRPAQRRRLAPLRASSSTAKRPAAQQVVPYVDGQPVSYKRPPAAPARATSPTPRLYFMSRNASALFGAGDLDEVALYNRALNAAEVAAHFDASIDKPPAASFTATPNPVARRPPGQLRRLGAPRTPTAPIVKYEWDLDGNGSYETDTGETATASSTSTHRRRRHVGLRVTDNSGETATTTPHRHRPGHPAHGLLHRNAQPGLNRRPGQLRRLRLLRPRRDRSPNTSGTSTATAAMRPTPARRRPRRKPTPAQATSTIGLRVTDNDGATATTTR